DRRTPPAERRRVAGEVGARWALVCGAPWPGEGSPGAPGAAGRGDWELVPLAPEAEGDGDAETHQVPPGTAIIKLSSGSTGAARGIATPMEALLADDRALTATMGITPQDRLLSAIPFSHSYGLSSLVVPALTRGTLLVLPGEEGPFGPLAAAAHAGATVFPTVPAYLGGLARLADPPPLPPSLRLVLSAGAPLPPETSRRFRERYGQPVHVFYGASESGGICYDREGSAAERGTVGTPVEGVSVTLEEEGRVVVRSPAVALGYLPGEGRRLGGGRYATDDLACWRDGELALVGRLNDLINVKGRKVNPKEVERVLSDLGAVDEVHVLPAPGGDQREQIVRAVIACRPGTLHAEDVLSWCREHLADHKVPRSVILVDDLPRTDRGKVDRAALASLVPRERLERAAGTGG
ncbi:MAG TPA: fatty acid--CoA ligase family protein, partial [Thermoanaerobaculia bacterium]|nr:fatty acid--CoA ligase family protein [Thermoanaerobaculia bacterium]